MKKTFLKKVIYSCFIFFTAITCSKVSFAVSEDYLKLANDSISYLEIGNTTYSISTLRQMYKYFGEDEFIKTVYATSLLFGNQPAEAESILKDLLKSNPYNKSIIFLAGIIKAKNGNIPESLNYFESISKYIQNYNHLYSYLNTMADSTFINDELEESNLSAMELSAYWNVLRKNNTEALETLKLICNIKGSDSYKDIKGILFSYLPESSFMFNASPFKGKLGLNVQEKIADHSLSGLTNIKANIAQSSEIQSITIFIDDQLKGMTNSYPYSFTINTENLINGIHEVRISAVGFDSSILTSKTFTIEVFNMKSSIVNNIDDVWEKLWNLIQIRQGMETVNYLLATCAAREKDLDTHRIALERCIAVNPYYRDTIELIQKYYFPPSTKKTIETGNKNFKQVGLTFDDGPTPTTRENLNILKKYNAKATFFIVGRMAEKYPDVLREIANDGHQIALHSQNHPNYSKLSYEETIKETFQNYCAIKATGVNPTLYFRPPGGNNSENIAKLSRDFGFKIALWTKNTTHLQTSTPEILSKYCIDTLKPGFIYLMHNNESVVTQALPILLDFLNQKAYKCTTMEEIIK